jgi:hypothetical protein
MANLPESKCWAVCAALLAPFKRPTCHDETDWAALIDVGDGGAAANDYLQAKLAPGPACRRARTLLKFLPKHRLIKSRAEHPFVVGGVKTNSAVDYAQLISAQSALMHWDDAVNASRAEPANHSFCGKLVMQNLFAAHQHAANAGPWPYNETLAPIATRRDFVYAVEIAILCGILQRAAAQSNATHLTADVVYGAAALLQTKTAAPHRCSATRSVNAWARQAALLCRLQGAAMLRDHRPPAAGYDAADAQLLLEVHHAVLDAGSRRRLMMGIALNGYMGTSASKSDLARAEAVPCADTLYSAVLSPALATLAAQFGHVVSQVDNLRPYEAFYSIRKA